jgi:phosphomannomutase
MRATQFAERSSVQTLEDGVPMAQLIVSISGIRGIVGDGLGPEVVERFALAFGTWLSSRAAPSAEAGGGDSSNARPRVVMARDSRPSGPELAEGLRRGLRITGCDVLDAGILSTPGLAVLVRHFDAAGGAVITASHNPAPYNGIKLMSPKGLALSRDEGRAVLDLYEQGDFARPSSPGEAETLESPARIHVERVLETVDADRIRAAGFTVAVDPVNGAGGAEMAALLDALGCEVVMINPLPDGQFGRGPEPVPANLADLGRAVTEKGAAVGLALDPDGDRLSLVDETGRAIGEEYTLALAARHRLSREPGPVAANLSTSRMMDFVASEAGVPLVRTPVGEVNVAEAIEREACVIGGEGNGGVIDPRVTLVRDSLAGAAQVLEMMAERGRKLSELVGELPVYTLVKDKVPLGEKDPAAVFAAVRSRFDEARLDERDGLHLSWEDGWVHVRASNTEPILRVMAESADSEAARGWVEEVKQMAAGEG